MGGLYSATILDHFRRPRNQGALPEPDRSHEGLNPTCGDRIRIELRIRGDVIEAARFRGDACMIGIAAASILTEMLHGMRLAEAETLPDETLLAALDAQIRPDRRSCAILPLDVLRAALRVGNGRPR